MEITPNVLFTIFFVLLVGGLLFALIRRAQAADADGELTALEYGQLVVQAHETAKIVVRGVQEAWRTGEYYNQETENRDRENDAVDQLVAMYPQLEEEVLRRIVKSAVYLLRLSLGKQVDKVMDFIPDEPTGFISSNDMGILTGHHDVSNTP